MSLDSINSNIEFTSKISLNSDNYTGDKIKFEEVILNLLQNAKDAVSEKTFTDSKGSIFLCAEKISDSIVISCTDNGCGISDDIVILFLIRSSHIKQMEPDWDLLFQKRL